MHSNMSKGDSSKPKHPSRPPGIIHPHTSSTTTTTWENNQDRQLHSSKPSHPIPSAANLTSTTTENMPPLTGDKSDKIRVDERQTGLSGIGGWFTGSSAPVTIGVPGETEERATSTEEEVGKTTPESPSLTSSPRSTLKRSTTTTSNMSRTGPGPPSASPSRFAFFSRSSAPKVVQVPSNFDDEFLNLDITTALFPNSPPDPFSPSSFKNLLSNAEALLLKLQTAYKTRTLAVYELTREKEAQADELEEAETRAAHLKTQLEDMGKKLLQQDHDILSISNELAAEKQLRADEKAASEQTLQSFKSQAQSAESRHNQTAHVSLVSRGSRSSFDSYNLDDSDSVFSHSRSHTSTSSAGTGITTPEIVALDPDEKDITPKASRANTNANTSVAPKASNPNNKMLPPPPPPQQKTIFSKILGGGGNTNIPNPSIKINESNGLGLSEMGCPNCRGGSSSVAWDAVGLLREENKHLKCRVSSLEDGVDDVLGLIVRSWR